MCRGKTLLITAIVLAMVSIANAELILTINELDATKPLEIEGKEDLIIAIAGQSDAKTQDISVTCDTGKLEPLNEPDKYLFTFTAESDVSIISLNVGQEFVYYLVLFYIPEKDAVVVFGVDKETLAASQPKPQPQLEQQTAASQTTLSEKSYFMSMSTCGTTQINRFPEPNFYPDINSDKIVNFVDFALFANNWQKSGGGLDGDFDNSRTVDTNDLATFAYFWLSGPHPLDVFESFKTALSVGDANEALTYIAEISREKYAEIFQIIEPKLADYVAGMGQMTFDRQRNGEVIYEMRHQDGPETLSFPVFFIREEDGNWRLFNF